MDQDKQDGPIAAGETLDTEESQETGEFQSQNRRSRGILVLFAAVAIATAAWLGYVTGQGLHGAGVGKGGSLLAVADPSAEWLEMEAPEAEFETLSGGTVSLADFQGQIVLLNFWGTWCAPCVYEIPELVKLQPELAQLGATVLGPAIDSGSPARIRSFLAKYDVNYPIVIGKNSVAIGDFGVYGYPFTLLIDRSGTIRRTYIGPQKAEMLLADVKRLIEEEGAG